MSTNTSRVLWKANTTRHDWCDGGPLRSVVAAAARLGVIGRADSDPFASISAGDALADAILAVAATQGRTAEVNVTGSDPAPWELFWNVYPFDTGRGWVDGFNTLWLTFDRSVIRDSDALLDAFFTAHTPDDTEYAVLHPYDHWSDFADLHYRIPVTINLTFRGVFWANFLGPGHVEEFDRARLRDLDAHEVRWIDERGLFVVATPDLVSADAPQSEPILLRLTQRFRKAHRPTDP